MFTDTQDALSIKHFLLFIMLLIGMAAQAQEDLQFEHRLKGPYPEDGTKYLIRVIFNFMDGESSDGNWWSVMGYNPAEEAQAGLDNLNGAFNEHGIYFLAYGAGYCEGAAYYNAFTEADLPTDVSIEQSLKTSRGSYQPQDEIDHALNIYVLPPFDGPAIHGDAHAIPNNYAWIKGYDTITGLSTHSTTLPHEVGHALGLLHPHAANFGFECDEQAPGPEDLENCEPPTSISYCCGDFVDETPYYTNTNYVDLGADCNDPDQSIPEVLIRNYMSYVTPLLCRNEFLGEQVGRMKKYLRELHAPANGSVNLLKDIQYLSVYPGEIPSGLTGNFTVESGTCTLTEPLQMLPGSTIRVRHGATLRIQTKLTKSCSELWGGIVVEAGGRVILQGQQAVVEHAICGIFVDGGGEAQVWGGKLRDNETGLWLQSNNAQSAEGQVMFAEFLITDDYQGGPSSPKLIYLKNVEQLQVAYTDFKDERSCPTGSCPGRAEGIYAEESSFLSRSNDFTLLNTGVWVNNMSYEYGAPVVRQCNFVNTLHGVFMEHTAGFTVEDNTFTFNDALETYPPFFKKVYGVYVRGLSDGFEVVENDFTNLHFNTAVYIPHGTYCNGTGAGLGNLIGHNSYFGMLIGNEAQGQNGDMDNGLLYICNNHDPELPGQETGALSDEVIDYRIGGAIRNIQADLSNADEILPTGNVFSPPSDPEIENTSGISFQYYYDGNFSNQAPNSSTGIDLEELIDILPEEYCTSASCPPPCKEGPIAIKERFQERGHLQDSLKTLLANGGSPAYLEEITKRLQASRWQKDKAAGTIIRYYAQDTLQVLPDSIGRWLGQADTYGAAYALARQAFFKGELSDFDQQWSSIPAHFALSAFQVSEYEALSKLFELLRPHFAEGGDINSLPKEAIESLFDFTPECNEAGALSITLLRRNKALAGIVQPCNGAQAFRAERHPQKEENLRKEVSKATEFRIFPNPAQGTIQIMLPSGQEAGYLRVYNLQGQRLLEHSLQGRLSEVDIPLSSGVYLFAVQPVSNGAPFWQKIIIQ